MSPITQKKYNGMVSRRSSYNTTGVIAARHFGGSIIQVAVYTQKQRPIALFLSKPYYMDLGKSGMGMEVEPLIIKSNTLAEVLLIFLKF